ncbi:MAG: pyruvate kinase [Bacillota bacterium]
MIKTKIYSTIGPACYQTENLIKMIEKGMDGIRINLSHGNLPIYEKWIRNIKEAEIKTNKKIPILADIQGPEIRTGLLKEKEINLQKGNEIILSTGQKLGSKGKIFINWPEDKYITDLRNVFEKGQKILIDDGIIKLEIISIEEKELKCQVLRGDILGERKGVNIPGVTLSLPSLTEKDKLDLKTGIKLGIDYIMLPFTRNADDIKNIKKYLSSLNSENIGVFAKIENQEGIDNFESFIDLIEGVVIARGDLGVEIGLTRVPMVQKELIKLCAKYQKESIVVTHMLHSMINSPLPTRAEISDIANAVLDGCSSVMLTGETAIGKYPVESIEIMYKTISDTEKWKTE